MENINPVVFREYWDAKYLFRAYLDSFGDVALAISLVLWTLSFEEFEEWDLKIQ
jgi:hypothetical protein